MALTRSSERKEIHIVNTARHVIATHMLIAISSSSSMVSSIGTSSCSINNIGETFQKW
jgi:hypothetical protein